MVPYKWHHLLLLLQCINSAYCIMSTYNLNVRIPENEKEILEKYCEKTSRSKTEVIRELIRSLEPRHAAG
jgi:hypothetical protein